MFWNNCCNTNDEINMYYSAYFVLRVHQIILTKHSMQWCLLTLAGSDVI